ncbi:MAG TPA: sigma 54-interacting transcriptional regulator [Sedimentibacter sp.]|nr:sigma 54-interacting transcriptional regulator [Sedimentibacter sp.]
MKKRITIIAIDEKMAEGYKKDIRNFFEDTIVVEASSIDKIEQEKKIETDLILISANSIFRLVKPYAPVDCEIITINKTLSKKGFEKIKDLPEGTNALLVNIGPYTAAETILLLYNIARKDIELYPYYPGIKEYPKLDLAITPGEKEIVPKNVKNIIDIGNRVTDVSTILSIITNLKLDKEKYKKKIFEYYNETIPSNYAISNIVTENLKLENQIDILFENLNEGIITYDQNGVIIDNNSSVGSLIKVDTQDLTGKKIMDVFPIKTGELLLSDSIERVLKINDNDIIVTIVPAKNVGLNNGGIIILKKFSDVERKMHEHRKTVIGKGHKTKYTLNDIIGSSPEIKKCKQTAIRMAKSESAVLITGESGTGKELFAHVIHDNSNRKYNQFVAVNCSSFPENLLESELFGYEDGAFTGSKKGGKPGLFEIAHGGSLFLDEIGEMPMHLQNRLLRVLQEHEVMRIGGDNVIHVDVRIITATNTNIEDKIKQGSFRKDLYYRLNVLPLHIPPLRERKGDVLEILDYYKKKFKGKFVLSDEVKDLFENYIWEGNVRQLKNYIEYFANLDKLVIKIEDIPGTIVKNVIAAINNNEVILDNEQTGSSDEDIYLLILKILYEFHKQKKKIGRKQMSIELEKYNEYKSEQEVRKYFIFLEQNNYVSIGSGRGGTQITKDGIEKLNKTTKL